MLQHRELQWWSRVAVACWSRSTKLTYIGPGYYEYTCSLLGWVTMSGFKFLLQDIYLGK